MLGQLIQTIGVAWSFRVLAAITLVLGLPAGLLIRERGGSEHQKRFVEW
jgi:hypothetical protein